MAVARRLQLPPSSSAARSLCEPARDICHPKDREAGDDA
jgi:hypothetical protein